MSNISMQKMDHLVKNITTNNFIAINGNEIPLERHGNMKALYLTIKCKSYILPKALINNSSFLNVMPMTTLSKLPIDLSYMKKSHLVVRAYDGTMREVMGNIKLLI